MDSYGIFETRLIRQELVPQIEKDHASLENQPLGRKLFDSNLAIHQTLNEVGYRCHTEKKIKK